MSWRAGRLRAGAVVEASAAAGGPLAWRAGRLKADAVRELAWPQMARWLGTQGERAAG